MVVAASTTIVLGCLGFAAAAAAKPPLNQSYYIYNGSRAAMLPLGCHQAALQALGRQKRGEVILDFGGQTPYRGGHVNFKFTGTEATDGQHSFTDAQIGRATKRFVDGFVNCDRRTYGGLLAVRLGVGTDNSLAVDRYDAADKASTTAVGRHWSDLVGTIVTQLRRNRGLNETPYVGVYGASDLENDAHFSSGTAAQTWAHGFISRCCTSYIDYGDAAGCSQTQHNGSDCSAGEPGWSQPVEWNVAFGIPALSRNHPPLNGAPQIYYPGLAQQWTQIALWAYSHHHQMYFQGPLDQGGFKQSFSNSQAWNNFVAALNRGGLGFVVRALRFSLSIKGGPG